MSSSTTIRVNADSRSKGSMRLSEAPVIAALTVALLLGLPGRGQAYLCSTPSFAAHQEFLVGSSSASVAVGYFNADSNPDLAVTNAITSSVSILLGDAVGGFGAPTDIAVGTNPFSVAVGDFNNDTKMDLAVADVADGNLWVLLGNGLGGFGTPTAYPIGTQPIFVVVGRFNNDTNDDLAVMDYSNSGEVSILLGVGDGTFGSPTQFPVGGAPAGAAIGDFNGNGFEDLVVANLSPTNSVSRLLGNGDGTFGAPGSFPVGANPTFVAVGDFNGDLKQDLAVTNSSAGTVSVLLGNGSGGFGSATAYTVGTGPFSVGVGDVNGDGKQDLVVANTSSHTLSVLLGDGIGGFGTPVNFPVDHNPGLVALADFNHDGKTDIVVTETDTNSVSVLLNACDNPTHDTVVLPVNPVAVTIAVGKTSVTKNLSVKVRNADPAHTSNFNVELDVDDSDCAPGVVASVPDFVSSQPGSQNPVLVAAGSTKTAKVVLTVTAGAVTSFNRNAPHRCTLWFTSSAAIAEPNADPTLSNNTLPVEVSITDLNDANQTAVHETTIASLKPLKLTIASGKSSKTLTARPKVGNADANEVPDTISAAALDGSCPIGTVGAVDLSTLSGIQSSAAVASGAKKSGTLLVTGTSALCTPNKLAPQRCIATVSATGPGFDSDGSNNTTRLVIDMVDKNDFPGSCIP